MVHVADRLSSAEICVHILKDKVIIYAKLFHIGSMRGHLVSLKAKKCGNC